MCAADADAGGWGPVEVNSGEAAIPSRNIAVANNLLYNPTGRQTAYTHFAFEGDATPSPTFRNIPPGARADDNLSIRGNIVWNGSSSMPTGAGDPGCLDTNASCNDAQLRVGNAINDFEPALIAPVQGNFHPLPNGNLAQYPTLSSPGFSWGDAPSTPAVPAGALSNRVVSDRYGVTRSGQNVAGAYATVSAIPLAYQHCCAWLALAIGE